MEKESVAKIYFLPNFPFTVLFSKSMSISCTRSITLVLIGSIQEIAQVKIWRNHKMGSCNLKHTGKKALALTTPRIILPFIKAQSGTAPELSSWFNGVCSSSNEKKRDILFLLLLLEVSDTQSKKPKKECVVAYTSPSRAQLRIWCVRRVLLRDVGGETPKCVRLRTWSLRQRASRNYPQNNTRRRRNDL